ncbi:hypothetical protein [Pseudobacteriovorax antillogorgiicola]|uniref:Uncharacterized protein n=1 Tax=Pseudobacteriovorax antillogorgiicola TaxID=1513793 RepID=A0A1Y6CT15_9BACT|nr:hypothetical protein [Pseudobacteriovorax antillogorgiicola]TCS45842.1 hypothetical protein EDD56_1265 [Pseudobacteriovorax antillogorgiicola]SMF71837.1 hypothetical protein SAMN06296036_12693 [Pseudobacteriovorax antillogorgiicola]
MPLLGWGIDYIRPDSFGFELGCKLSKQSQRVTNEVYHSKSTTPASASYQERGLYSGLLKQLYEDVQLRLLLSAGLTWSEIAVSLSEKSFHEDDSGDGLGVYLASTLMGNFYRSFTISLRTEIRRSNHRLDHLGIDQPHYDGSILLGFHLAPPALQDLLN